MALIQEVKNGQLVDQKNDPANKKKEPGNEMGQDQFLQLLVAQMQYQDPLEPTSNTEWVAQMATFSMVESLNTMKSAMSEQSAYDLVGKFVLIKDGESFVKGKVDYITKQNGETVLSVNDKFYTLDKLDTIADKEYFEGSVQANELHEMIQLLPSEDNLTALDDGLVKSAREAYNALSDSQKAFVKEEDLDKLTALEAKMDALKATYFNGMVNKLPGDQELTEADTKTLTEYADKIKEAREYYDGMTEKQKKNVTEVALSLLQSREEALKKVQAQTGADDSTDSKGDASDADVSAILQKILSEIQKQNGTETAQPSGQEVVTQQPQQSTQADQEAAAQPNGQEAVTQQPQQNTQA